MEQAFQALYDTNMKTHTFKVGDISHNKMD